MSPEYVLIAFTRPPECRKGEGLSIMTFITKSYNRLGEVEFEREPTPEAVEAEISKGDFKFTSWRFISPEDIPVLRDYREAWEDPGNKKIQHNLPKAREVHRQKLRKERAALLTQLDTEYLLADEQDNTARKREVAQEKQRLRDVTDDPRIEAAQTVEELRTVNPLIKEESAKPDNKKANKK